ncbi:hypothetical protein BD414DRAFT_180060 [Trametes punicea]|nr:hypothetical protein BD414DRAFT_180060 [Trametes punicea]
MAASALADNSGSGSLTVSLEDHLAQRLRPLLPLLPPGTAEELNSILTTDPPELSRGEAEDRFLEAPPVKTIPYTLLSSISRWTRTPEGVQALASHEPPLRQEDYAMVALLAGTRTCPNRRYPSVPVPATADDALTSQKRELGDRRAVTAVINALLSVAGSGVAVYWAAGRLTWKEEWKVLLALFVAIVVASSEAILYLIWHSRRSKSKRNQPLRFHGMPPRARRRAALLNESKSNLRDDSGGPHDPVIIAATSAHLSGTETSALRERVRRETEESGAGRRN